MDCPCHVPGLSARQCLAFIPQAVSIAFPVDSLFIKERQSLAKVAQDLLTATQCCVA